MALDNSPESSRYDPLFRIDIRGRTPINLKAILKKCAVIRRFIVTGVPVLSRYCTAMYQYSIPGVNR